MMQAPRPTEENLKYDPVNKDDTKLWPKYAVMAIKLGERASTGTYGIGERTDLIKQAQLHAAVAQDLRERNV